MWLVCGRIARASLGGVDFPAPVRGGGGDALSGTYARRVCGLEPWFCVSVYASLRPRFGLWLPYFPCIVCRVVYDSRVAVPPSVFRIS